MNFPIVTDSKEIESNIIDITDKLLQVNPMQYKVTPWFIKRCIKVYVAWVTMPLYFVNVVVNNKED